MDKRIIYKRDDGGVSVIVPAPGYIEWLMETGITETEALHVLAHKDVPTGKPYKIIDKSELPDRSMRDAWTVDEAELTDGVGE